MRWLASLVPDSGTGSSCSNPPSTESRSSSSARTADGALSDSHARHSIARARNPSRPARPGTRLRALLELPHGEEVVALLLAEAHVLRRDHRPVQRLLVLACGHRHFGGHPDAVDLLELRHLEVLEARSLLHPAHAADHHEVVLAHE